VVSLEPSVKLIEEALEDSRAVGLLTAKDGAGTTLLPGDLYTVGTLGVIRHAHNAPKRTLHVIVEGLERFQVELLTETDPCIQARIVLKPDVIETGPRVEALKRTLSNLTKEVFLLSDNLPDGVDDFLDRVEDPRYLTYWIAASARLGLAEGQKILEMDSVRAKMQALIEHMAREKEILTLGKKIQSETCEEILKSQREYYLREQLKAIRKELGDKDHEPSIVSEYEAKIEKADMPEEGRQEAQRELKRLKGMSPNAAEYSVIKTYLDWLLELPWNVLSEDRLNIPDARAVLDEDHYDLEDVKERLVEYLVVRKLLSERRVLRDAADARGDDDAMGVILCFVGPPGVGKTSLGQSIARALGRKFTRMSLGGMRDEAEIRGHRRTYIGAMPGRIIQAIKRAGTRNPVFMLDEVDKIGTDWRGDPSSALLEVLDPAQNHTFRDYYLDVDFDLSDVIFITTANQLETIPPPLRDRMEILELEGYTEFEKIRIAQEHLVPRQIRRNGLLSEEISFTEGALFKIVQDYTREAGVRNLERQIGSICRKAAVRMSARELSRVEVTPELVREFLKSEKFESETSETSDIPGIATALAVTAFGGDILFIEATGMKGKGELNLTGHLGEVMRESAQIAHSYVRSNASRMGIDPDLFRKTDVHLHVPSGAVPKDGPSAGVAMVMAIASLFSGRPVSGHTGMTGEVTLRGRVLPVGGIKMKVLAAHRARIEQVILPKHNEKDLQDLPEDVRLALRFVPVERIEEAVEAALLPSGAETIGGEDGMLKVMSSGAASRNQQMAPTTRKRRISYHDWPLLDEQSVFGREQMVHAFQTSAQNQSTAE
jgi:ATP-dependent Lon protease